MTAALARLSPPPDAAWVGIDHLHVTLRFLGDVHADLRDFEELKQACAMIAPREVAFGPGIRRLGPDALAVPVAGADGLAATTRATVAKAETVSDPPRFFGHMTLALPETPYELAWAERMLDSPLSGRWIAEEVCVFVSETVGDVKRYRVLARLPLTGPPPVREV